MDETEFQAALLRLINRARAAETIPLEMLIAILDTELEGLTTAHDEGEDF